MTDKCRNKIIVYNCLLLHKSLLFFNNGDSFSYSLIEKNVSFPNIHLLATTKA